MFVVSLHLVHSYYLGSCSYLVLYSFILCICKLYSTGLKRPRMNISGPLSLCDSLLPVLCLTNSRFLDLLYASISTLQNC